MKFERDKRKRNRLHEYCTKKTKKLEITNDLYYLIYNFVIV